MQKQFQLVKFTVQDLRLTSVWLTWQSCQQVAAIPPSQPTAERKAWLAAPTPSTRSHQAKNWPTSRRSSAALACSAASLTAAAMWRGARGMSFVRGESSDTATKGDKYRPTDLRHKKTRALRRALTTNEQRKKTAKQTKKDANFPLRRYAVRA